MKRKVVLENNKVKVAKYGSAPGKDVCALVNMAIRPCLSHETSSPATDKTIISFSISTICKRDY